ncbi:hypothetical protein ACH5RR_033351 [Cinchona calisaya]|uniref:Uncharacterized protein n=1 Tax=Cinchona calisaya TaxID=153742 RepID=A0ABD2YPS4_9GENT
MEAVAVELDDDVFFADLSKQISLLIMDDDEDLVTRSPSISLQALSQSMIHQAPQAPFLYDQQACRRESKGTGVFIPRSSQPRRKNKQGRYSNTSSNAKFQRNNHESSRGLTEVAYSTNNKAPYYDSFNLRRF